MLLTNPPTGCGEPPTNQISFWRRCSLGDTRKHEMKNSLSRCKSKFLIISSKELPACEPEELNTHALSEPLRFFFVQKLTSSDRRALL
jgi:hypothetical protein